MPLGGSASGPISIFTATGSCRYGRLTRGACWLLIAIPPIVVYQPYLVVGKPFNCPWHCCFCDKHRVIPFASFEKAEGPVAIFVWQVSRRASFKFGRKNIHLRIHLFLQHYLDGVFARQGRRCHIACPLKLPSAKNHFTVRERRTKPCGLLSEGSPTRVSGCRHGSGGRVSQFSLLLQANQRR